MTAIEVVVPLTKWLSYELSPITKCWEAPGQTPFYDEAAIFKYILLRDIKVTLKWTKARAGCWL